METWKPSEDHSSVWPRHAKQNKNRLKMIHWRKRMKGNAGRPHVPATVPIPTPAPGPEPSPSIRAPSSSASLCSDTDVAPHRRYPIDTPLPLWGAQKQHPTRPSEDIVRYLVTSTVSCSPPSISRRRDDHSIIPMTYIISSIQAPTSPPRPPPPSLLKPSFKPPHPFACVFSRDQN